MEENFALLAKYNFWNGNVPELGFIRVGYTDKIFDYIGKCAGAQSFINHWKCCFNFMFE